MPRALRPLALAAAIAAVLTAASPARAQSVDLSLSVPNGPISVLRIQPDRKILVGGYFTNWNNLGGTPHGIARLNLDGSVDPTFYGDQEADAAVLAIGLQADGGIVIGGEFARLRANNFTTVMRMRIGRLNANGTLDTGFDPGADGYVHALAIQPDGKILVGGRFLTLGGGRYGTFPRHYFGRLNPDGTLDQLFKGEANSHVYAVALQADGKIVVGGLFTELGTVRDTTGAYPRFRIGRFNPDGSVDTTFNPAINTTTLETASVNALAVQPDGKILVGGNFTSVTDSGYGPVRQRQCIARLNADGTVDTTFDPGMSPVGDAHHIKTLVVQADGGILVGGNFDGLGGAPRNNIGRLNANGSIDVTFDPGADFWVHALAQQEDGKVVVGGQFGLLGGGGRGTTARAYLGRLNTDAAAPLQAVLDPGFDPGAGPAASIPKEVSTLAVQVDGKILVGGGFTTLGGGGTGTAVRNFIGRLNIDGSLDTAFNPGANYVVTAFIVQPDGKIVVGGHFTMLGGGGTGTTARNGIGRLNADGTLDTSFNPGKTGGVNSLARQADGRIVVGGTVNFGDFYTQIDWIGRLNANGTVDTSFAPGANDVVFAVAVQPDQKIVVGGRFSRLGGGGSGVTTRYRIGRLNTDGSIDAAFNPGADSEVYAVAVQPDGKILLGGNFLKLGGGTGTTPRSFIGRLNADGSVDSTFNPGANGAVSCILVQSDGKILVGGTFTMIGGGGTGATARSYMARLNGDGSVDTSFNPGANWAVKAFGVQGDGKIVVGGGFTMLGGGGTGTTARSHLGRLTTASPASPVGYGSNTVPAGASQPVSVQTPAGGVNLTFSSVTTGGTVTVQTPPANPSDLARAPSGFKFLLWATFDVAATAVFGSVDVCVPYTQAQVAAAGLSESTLRLFYIPADRTAWVDVTKRLDTAAKKLCGTATHLSTFAIAGLTTSLGEPPFGQVDTPVQNAAGIVGAIPVTGWALDDVGVARVRIYRNCTTFEPPVNCQTIGGASVVYVGDAAFLAGARPDVEAAFPGYPQANRAGWGYLMLTNMLPHMTSQLGYGGQGPLVLYAFAVDIEGRLTLLGRSRLDHSPTAITLANDTIAKPFGAIDTPSQGQTVSGPIANFGWVLTPDTDTRSGAGDITILPDGTTMNVVIDGAAVGKVSFDQCRGSVGNPVPVGLFCDDDVASIFGNPSPRATFTVRSSNPTRFRNLDAGRAAIGSYDINTAALSNGLHTIAWGVIDSAGRVEGIGSRFFIVENAAAGDARADTRRQADAGAALGDAPAVPRGDARPVEALPASGATVRGRTGFDFDAPFEIVPGDDDGARHVQIPELGRVELDLGAVERGYLVANGTLRDLPPGSRLDPADGRFTWMPGPGYIGTYRLAFVQDGGRIGVTVTIRPRRTTLPGESEIRMFVDLPKAGQTVPARFDVAGWALDPQAAFGSGIGLVHVWARRRDAPAAAPIFLGAADLGVARPDIARAFGKQFRAAGFGLSVSGLPPGGYDVTAYAWNRRTARWEDARTVLVTVR